MLHFFAAIGMIFVGLAVIGALVIAGWFLNLWRF